MPSTSKKKNKKHHKKHRVVLPYIKTPIIYVLISMIIAVPVMLGLMYYAVNTVHKAQDVLVKDYYDVEVVDDNNPNDQIELCECFGTLSCKDVGLNTAVYYGINRVSMRDGVGMSTSSALEEHIDIAGYPSGAFRALYDIEIGDTIELDSVAGDMFYEVVDISVKEVNTPVDGSTLVLCTAKDTSPFSFYDNERLFVTARRCE